MGWRPTSSFARNACRSAPLGPLATMQHEESPPHTRRSRVALYLTTRAVAAGTVICVLSACSATSPMSHILPTRRPSDNPAWLLTRSALSRLALEPAVKARLHASRVFEILQPGQSPVAQVPAEPVVIFESATALEAAVNRGEIAARTYGVLYDPEAWRLTPSRSSRGRCGRLLQRQPQLTRMVCDLLSRPRSTSPRYWHQAAAGHGGGSSCHSTSSGAWLESPISWSSKRRA